MALPEPEPEPEPQELLGELYHLDAPRLETPTRPDDGLLHPRGKDVVFAGAPRGVVATPAERARLTGERLLGLEGAQLAGAAAVTLLCWVLALRALSSPSAPGTGIQFGICASLGVLIPVAARILLRHHARTSFWWHWCASRGFQPGAAQGTDTILPGLLDRSPLVGGTDGRHFEHVARRQLAGRREAVVGSLVRPEPLAPDAEYGQQPLRWRAGIVIMPLPEVVAARWAGASIRADHHAQRPMVLRAMQGGLVTPGFAECRAHLAVVPGQDPHMLQRLVDHRLDQYLSEHPLDVDIVGDLLVVTRCGAPDDMDTLDELCRDALLLHELLVAEHELPVPVRDDPVATAAQEEPVIDLTREGWGGGGEVQYYEAA